MSSPIQNQTTTRAGLCPHGLPPAACPICSAGGMSGASKIKDTPAAKPMKSHSNEWSWMKCYAAGLAMRANEARIENAKTAFEKQIEFAKQLGKEIQQLADKIKAGLENIQKSMPQTFANVINFISNAVIFPVLNIIAQIPKLIEKLAQFQQNITDILRQAGEKLTAILGDLKIFTERTFTEKIKKKAKKFFLFFISNMEDENYQNDEILAIFKSRELRKLLAKIIHPTERHNKDADRSIKSK